MNRTEKWIRWFDDLTSDDVGRVGGKNSSLGEMIRTLKEQGIRVPGGFATTAEAYRRFLEVNELEDKIRKELGWEPQIPELKDIIASAWEWHKAHPNGYE